MARLAERIELQIGTRSRAAPIELRPTLRAALRLSREFDFATLPTAIAEGSLTGLAAIVRECAVSNPGSLPHDPFPRGLSLALSSARIRNAALSIVEAFIADPDEDKPQAKPSQSSTGKPFDAVRYFEGLFGFATGILKWTPEAAWNATPGEIRAAIAFRERAYAPKDGKGGKRRDEVPDDKLTLGQKARKLFANIGTRVETSDA